MFDFVIFENWHLATNHHKDVGLIASMLKDSGFTVAVADVYQNIDKNFIEGVPCITIKHKVSFLVYPRTGLMSKWPFVKIIGTINRNREARHLKCVMKELKGKYKHLYCGSYYVKMPIGWLHMIPDNTSAFFWGLRSARLVQYKNDTLDFAGINSYFLRRFFVRHSNLKFFVSDQLIYDEFVALGISKDRLVIRPERYIVDYPTITQRSNNSFKLLSIGSLRPEKRIERILAALGSLKDDGISYIIAGAAKPEYESVMESEIGKNNLENVKRLNYRLSEDEFNELINQTDFLVLCDRQQASNVTNGTMNEALLAGVPIIAPNYDPYRYFIVQYSIGLLFNPDDENSLPRAILEAKKKGRSSFEQNIKLYQSLFLKKNVVENFSKSLRKVLE